MHEELVAELQRTQQLYAALDGEHAALRAQANALAEEGERLRAEVGLHDMERAEITAQLRTVVTERDELQVHLRELGERLDAELEQGRAHLAGLGAERDALQARVWALVDERQRVGHELEDVRAQREYLADDLQATRDSLQHAAASLEELNVARTELLTLADRLRAEVDDRQAQLRHAQAALNEIYNSRSWRITAPLRQVTIAGRRMIHASSNLIHRPRRLLSLPAPASTPAPSPREEGDGRVIEGHFGERTVASAPPPPTPAPAPRKGAASAAELIGLPEPAYERRQHPGLRAFLAAEFGETPAAGALLRIDRYRLPIDTTEVRGTAKATCTDDEARYWAAALARRAERRNHGGDAPDVSIVIPVYNQVPFTLACIDSLFAQQSRYTFEILIGDDASTDATPVAFAQPIEGLTYVRHADNLGFVRNCNTTAAQARGRYVVMLNNDTQVLPGWLDELIDVLEGDASVGLVGSKLIYPDGRMQECGGIIWQDGSAWNFGRLDDPRKPEYCYLRGIDYVSGASIALPMALWRKLGGFDEHYVPAYAEDADLAFRVRAAGLATLVQPLSQLLHFEGVSSGTDLGAGAKAYQVENLRKLHARWAKVLAGHRPNAERPDLEKERGVSQRVLFVDHTTLTPNEDAGSLVAFEILQSLRKLGYKVTFVPEDNFAHVGADTRALQRLGIETIYHPAYSRMEQFLATRNDPFDLVVMHRFSVGDQHLGALKAKWPDAKFVFLACDLHHLREMREAELSGDPAAMARALDTRDRELAVARSADAIMVYSEAERDLLAAELPGANVVLFPLVHDPIAAHVELAGRDGVCFVGGYRHPPNADGITWFAEHAWPIVRARRPDDVLYVVGSHMTDAVRALGDRKGIEIVGFVEDMEDFLAKRRVNVAPLRYGAGVKGKVSAALANGVPTVCTPIAAEGMQLSPGVDILVGQAPAELAELVIELLADDDRWRQVSDAGLDYAARVTSRASAHRRIRAMLGSIGLAPGGDTAGGG
jgi:GT2 family glycosyltransferase/glycosyltransferase involved in cell wall biosynthesis